MEPTNLTAPQWTNALWARLTSLIEDLTSACIKVTKSNPHPTLRIQSKIKTSVPAALHDQVYTLEKVLKRKKDPVSQVVFLDEAMKVTTYRS